MSKKNTLYLIPTPIGKRIENRVMPEYTLEIVRSLKCFLVEKPQTSISFLKWVQHPLPDFQLTLRVLNKKTPDHEVYSFLKLLEEQDVGLMSEAGAPGIADPGAVFIELAHQNDFEVVPLTGPSSIFLALMSSGLNGQKFAFHGYLSINDSDRIREINNLEEYSRRYNQTQIFMETPHRNQLLFNMLLKELNPAVKLCVACNLTMDDETIIMKRIADWQKSELPDLQRKPSLFLINAH